MARSAARIVGYFRYRISSISRRLAGHSAGTGQPHDRRGEALMSDMAEESRHGRIITFYSYKGGIGRTMALANVAWILAANGYRVLVADWDLESPGLHRFLYPFLEQVVRDARGI